VKPLVWDAQTSTPIHPAIVWRNRHCRRLLRRALKAAVMVAVAIKLSVDRPYFSATKLRWILEQVRVPVNALERGELHGTVDSFCCGSADVKSLRRCH
jgi:glycerol kinase